MKPILILFAQESGNFDLYESGYGYAGILKTDTDVGYYNAAVKIKSILVKPGYFSWQCIAPRMSYYAKERRNGNLWITIEMAF